MPHTIDVAAARRLLLSREEVRERGVSERQLQRLVRQGVLIRVKRGRYIDVADWDDLWNEGRHLVEVVATSLNSDRPGPVFWGPSAAVLHGLPLYRTAPRSVHVAIEDARHGRRHAGTMWHNTTVEFADIVDVGGIRCTSRDRTTLDLARTLSAEAALSAADAALRVEAVVGHVQDTAIADDWRARLLNRAGASHGRGVRQARRIIAFADGRAQLPGESVSRLQLDVLGFRGVELQARVVGPSDEDYWLDFAFKGARAFGEFDGRAKYLDADMRSGRSIEQVLLDEKRREDTIRGVTGWRIVRWDASDIALIDRFAARLAAFGIRPPG